MGKRSSFRRRPMDNYATPHKPIPPLLSFLKMDGITTYTEPCCGDGDLINHLNCYGFQCIFRGDIRSGQDALDYPTFPGDAVITNPPWTRALLHPLISHFMRAAPVTWLLFDADWAHTKQAAPFLPHCSHIVTVGRLRWIPGTRHTSKDNAAWFRFQREHKSGPHFYGRPWEPSLLDIMEAAE